jgi:hypothetical protein
MLFYKDGNEVRAGDRVTFLSGDAVVERIVEGDELEEWQLDEPGFLLVCEQFGRIMVNPGSSDWEEVGLVSRAPGD